MSFSPDPHPVPYALGIQYQSFFIIAVTGVVFIGVWLFFERTVAGKSFEAVAIHRRAAALMGINLSRAGTVGVHPAFVSMLREMILDRVDGHAVADECRPDCCAPPARPAHK